MFAAKFKKLTEPKGESGNAIKCMVFDDTVIAKTGRCIEKISRVWDHVSNSYLLAYKMLLMGYWDGVSFVPLDFSFHREKGKNKEKPFGLKKNELKKVNAFARFSYIGIQMLVYIVGGVYLGQYLDTKHTMTGASHKSEWASVFEMVKR